MLPNIGLIRYLLMVRRMHHWLHWYIIIINLPCPISTALITPNIATATQISYHKTGVQITNSQKFVALSSLVEGLN